MNNWNNRLVHLHEPNGAAGSAGDADRFDCVSTRKQVALSHQIA
jgi:hypothetical protein